MLTKEEWQDFSTLFLFENHLNDKKANFVCVSDGYLWRRDAVRLVAYKLQEEGEKSYHYPLSVFQDDRTIEYELDSKGNMVLKAENGEMETVQPIDVPYRTNSIKTLFSPDFDTVFSIRSKSLVKTLLVVQRKLMNHAENFDHVQVSIHLDENQLKIHLEEEIWEYELNIDKQKVGEERVIFYSYLLFKEFLINANSFEKETAFFVSQPYFTVIQYNEKVRAVLNHKRKKSE